MQLQITFRNMKVSQALEARIRELVQKLERFSSQIIRCQVVVDAPHHAPPAIGVWLHLS
jgi:ribosome-associated translation inhibitor RaiA